MLRARDTKLPIAAFPDLGTASNRLFQVLVPVESGGRFVAFIVGVFDAAAVLDTLESFAPGYGITILAGAKPVFERTLDATDDPAMAEAAFDWAGATWRVRVEPGAKALDRIRSGLPETALIGGLSLSLLLALSVFLAQKAARGEQRAVLANRRMERLWSSGVVGIFDIRLDGSVIQANDEMLRILGYDRADIASGRLRWDGLTPPEHAAADARALEELDATDVASLYEKELFRKDGSRIPVLTGIAVVDPALRDGVVLVLDQTARHRAEEAASRLASIVESSEDAIMSAALDFTITSWNAGATRLYGYTAEEMIGGGTGSLIPPDRLEATQEAVAQVAQGGRLTQFESIRVRKDGTRIEVSMTISPVRDASGRVIGVSAIAHDISLRKRAEEELRQAKETAESADRAKSAFVANISHELRTPLNGILGMLDLCLDTALDDVQLGQIQTARRAAEALLVIVNDLLDIAKIEAGKLDIESIEFDLRDCLRDTMHSLQLSARQKLLEFSRYVAPDVPSLVMGDPGRLRQILVNLAGNAIKFTEQGEVSVACSIVSRTPDTAVVRLTVEDTGIGIPVEQQRAIFEPFAQADSSTTRRFGGTGLGLSISRLLIEKMGGQLALESEPGRGSRFSIELSLPVVRWEASLVLASLPAAIRGLRVLVVDDSAAVRAELEGWLASWQMRPDVVENASQALASLEAADVARDPFRLVLIDAELPETDGFALARSIRARSSPGDTTLLLLTRGGSPGDARRCADLSIRAYLRKPIDSSSCLEAILQSVADPALAGSNARLVTRHSLREQLGTMRILLVEDNAFNEAVAVQLLERQGVTVSVARNGATAVEAVREGRFDLVLMDVQMPVMDGMAATRAIRSDERGTDRHVPVIAMTARAMTGDRQACLDAGMDAYLPKPLDHKDLLRTIERLGLKRGVAPALPVELPAIGAGATSTIDRETLLKKVGGDVEFLGGLLDLFAVQASELLTDLREGLAEGNAESVRFAAHAMKGSIGNWTTGRPYELARDLEEGSPENAKDLFHSLETELALLERTLRDVEQDLRRSPGAPKSL